MIRPFSARMIMENVKELTIWNFEISFWQVRFIVAEDCLPVAEEKFKTVIKDNYYSKNKFNCQLTSEQV